MEVDSATVNIMMLINILKMTVAELRQYLTVTLAEKYDLIEKKPDYMYFSNGGDVLLIAHMDTVFKAPPKRVEIKGDILYGKKDGIGGDDRCGIYGVLEIAKNLNYTVDVLFTDKEEIGGIGARAFAADHPELNYDFFLELDRTHEKDCVFYECGNLEFQQIVEDYGFQTDWGSYTDICEFMDTYDTAGVNLSIGYYNPHTALEYINIKHLARTIEKATLLRGASLGHFTADITYGNYAWYNSYFTYGNSLKKIGEYVTQKSLSDYAYEEELKELYPEWYSWPEYDTPAVDENIYYDAEGNPICSMDCMNCPHTMCVDDPTK